MAKLKAIHATSLTLVLLASTAQADGFSAQVQFGGVFDWAGADSLDESLGFDTRQAYGGNLRLMWSGNSGPWSAEVHSLLSLNAGDTFAYGAAVSPYYTAPPPSTMFDLASVIHSDDDLLISNTIDRLSIGYASGNVVLKVGRQAVTWGSGSVFHPIDIVSAFAPNTIDTSYKPGVDMVYGQYLFDSGADIQAIYVPRPAAVGGSVDSDSSTFGAHGTAFIGDLDASLTLAQDRGDFLVGIGLSGPLGEAAWHGEIAHWSLENGDTATSFLLNVTNSGSMFGANVTYFTEYFRNGFGVTDDTAYDDLSDILSERLSAGRVFTANADTLALGAQISLTADITLSPNALISLNDGSALLGLQGSWIIDDNTDLALGYSHAIGSNGTEFGGRETSLGSGVFMRPSSNLSITLSRFF